VIRRVTREEVRSERRSLMKILVSFFLFVVFMFILARVSGSAGGVGLR